MDGGLKPLSLSPLSAAFLGGAAAAPGTAAPGAFAAGLREWAARRGHPDLELGDDAVDALALWAAATNQVPVMAAALARPSAEGGAAAFRAAVLYAAANGSDDALGRLLGDPRVPAALPGEALYVAAANGRVLAAARLLEDPRVAPAARDHALAFAVEGGHDDVVGLLVADPRVSPASLREGRALVRAASRGHTPVVARLLALPLEHRPPQDELDAALEGAALEGHAGLVALLLAKATPPPGSSERASTLTRALEAAVCKDRTEVVSLLLADDDARPAKAGLHVLLLAAECSGAPTLRLLLADPRLPLDPSYDFEGVLRKAVLCGRESGVVGLLLGDPRAAPFLADTLRLAAHEDQPRIVDLLLPRVPDPAARAGALAAAASAGSVRALDRLLPACPGIGADALGEALIAAAARGRSEVVVRLGSDPRVGPAARGGALRRAAGLSGPALRALLEGIGREPADVLLDMARHNQCGAVGLLLPRVQDPAVRARAVTEAANAGSWRALDRLLPACPEISPKVLNAAFARAVECHSFATVESLLADPRVDRSTVDPAALKPYRSCGAFGAGKGARPGPPA